MEGREGVGIEVRVWYLVDSGFVVVGRWDSRCEMRMGLWWAPFVRALCVSWVVSGVGERGRLSLTFGGG